MLLWFSFIFSLAFFLLHRHKSLMLILLVFFPPEMYSCGAERSRCKEDQEEDEQRRKTQYGFMWRSWKRRRRRKESSSSSSSSWANMIVIEFIDSLFLSLSLSSFSLVLIHEILWLMMKKRDWKDVHTRLSFSFLFPLHVSYPYTFLFVVVSVSLSVSWVFLCSVEPEVLRD